MKQKDKKNKVSGSEAFETHYASIFNERWPLIKEAFQKESDHVCYDAGGKEPYFLDSASVLAAASLPLSGAERILDLCAAPGGKTVVLASRMSDGATLLSNERSPDRKRRLSNTVENCLPDSVRERVTVICKDGSQLCLKNEASFDRILLDAPCSSERHVFSDPKYLSEWTTSRIKSICISQWALLSSAWRMLSPGGYLLYSTCALSPEENDGMISRLIKKFKDAEIIQNPSADDVSKFTDSVLPKAENTSFGSIVLPDSANGAGPLFFCLVKKACGE